MGMHWKTRTFQTCLLCKQRLHTSHSAFEGVDVVLLVLLIEFVRIPFTAEHRSDQLVSHFLHCARQRSE